MAEAWLRGEKLEAHIVILSLGRVSLLMGICRLRDLRVAFARGMALPCRLLGLVRTATGAGGLRSHPSSARPAQRRGGADPAAAPSAELTRREGVNRHGPSPRAPGRRRGLALRVTSQNDLAQGVGVALVFYAGVGLLIDGFADRRARPSTRPFRPRSRRDHLLTGARFALGHLGATLGPRLG